MNSTLYLIPNTIADNSLESAIPPANLTLIRSLKHFMVENVKTARRFLKLCGVPTPFEGIEFYTVNKRTTTEEKQQYMEPMLMGRDMGFISEAGCPAIADPGTDITAYAHANGIRVQPMVGPSSILLALIASGLNGQSFTFHGYLPVNQSRRARMIREIESASRTTHYTQVFMETPYRNEALFKDVLRVCHPRTRICVACNIMSEDEEITTLSAGDWKKMKVNLHKRPAIFLLNAG